MGCKQPRLCGMMFSLQFNNRVALSSCNRPAYLAALSRQVTTGAPWAQLSGLTIWAVAWGFDCILREPASQRKPRYQVIVLL